MFIRLYYYLAAAPCGPEAVRYGKYSICSCIFYPQVITIQICLHQFTVYCVLWFTLCKTLLNMLWGLVCLSLREVLSDESCKLGCVRCVRASERLALFSARQANKGMANLEWGFVVSCRLQKEDDCSERPPWHLHIWGAICFLDRQARTSATLQSTNKILALGALRLWTKGNTTTTDSQVCLA